VAVAGSQVDIENVHFQKAEYQNALIQLNKVLFVLVAVMTRRRRLNHDHLPRSSTVMVRPTCPGRGQWAARA
jgi:hypothetical protein